jgi:hypothetical protein
MPPAALLHFTPSPAIGELIAIAGVVVVVVALVRDRRQHPWVPRSGCNGTGIRRSRWNGRAIGPCRKRTATGGTCGAGGEAASSDGPAPGCWRAPGVAAYVRKWRCPRTALTASW